MGKLLSIASGVIFLLLVSSGNVPAQPKGEPFQAAFNGNVTVFEPIFTVLQKMRAEIEFISIRVIHTPDIGIVLPDDIFLRVATTVGTQETEHSLPLITLTNETRVAGHKVLFHADPGTEVRIQPTGGCDGPDVSCNVRASITGFLFKRLTPHA